MKKYVLSAALVVALFVSCDKDDNSGGETPIDTSALTFNRVGGFTNGTGDEGFAEISAYDKVSKKLFVVNPNNNEVSVWDLSSPESPSKLTPIALTGTPNSVATYNGLLAVAVENANKQANGKIVTYNTDTQVLEQSYAAGALPDMVTFSPDGKYIISANEGEPNDDYTIDPEGSITVVDLTKKEVVQLSFAGFNGQDIDNNFRVFGPGATVAQDIEPEYVAVSKDSRFAYVSLQENNGMAVVNLNSKSITQVFGLGVKDHMLTDNMLDASNKDDIVGNFKNWPVKGFYMPDAITYASINGTGYIISANEGDSRDYDGYSEEERVKDVTLDPTVFPNAADLQLNENLGRLKITTANGDTDNDGDFDELYSYGARSFTIWNTDGSLVYDSGDAIGKKTLEVNPAYFNADEGEADGRSDDKGTEPESVATLKIGDATLLFVGLERTGGVMVYDITNPAAPEYVHWIFNGSDVAPEGLLTVSAEDSPSGENLVIITNEVSNTVSIYEIK
ncbi:MULTISPECIES: choice-of-anchor I family protein [unclassified Cellulophaga]|uniref:choice-of-anchor I family protein n=1 Tax=unclassified Cellulophaga TaxID=2634405 RepID=UPI0026E2A02C|nr:MULTISPECIES: choice-of-anchor I family protein [unclassified Cellulophaga]MDO6491922.1 choice-of-anchor I family protein [Cellulophaga sp. 2_MG-2023]MDO6495423.1 choice-of-anchor I family protein [Cellulophaga sp. 3_MG-2023]